MTEDLYHAAILEAAQHGALDRRLASPASTATVDNPLCGDRVTIDLELADGAVARIGYRVRGCALCQAATALLAEAAHGHPAAAVALGERLVRALVADGSAPAAPWHDFAMFAPVSRFPSRHGCVLIPFEAFTAAAKR